MQGTPAGFPSGIPGMGEEMEGAMQHAPQYSRQSIKKGVITLPSYKVLPEQRLLPFTGVEIR